MAEHDPIESVSVADLQGLHPADIADRLQRLPVEEACALLAELPPPIAADVVAELEEAEAEEILRELPGAEVGRIIGEMPAHDAADLASDLPPAERREALAQLTPESAARVSDLLQYPPDSAGGIMVEPFLTLHPDQTVADCQKLLRAHVEQAGEPQREDVSYLFVTDAAGNLLGVVSLRDLVFRRPERRIGELMDSEVTRVPVDADQETIARLFQQYHYLALPVIRPDGYLVGMVLANQVIDVLKQEVTEDMQLMVGLSGEEQAWTPWSRAATRRLPWLYVNLATAFAAAAVVALFEDVVARWTALAVFLPVIAGQGGNAGAQTLTVVIRAMALGEISPGDGRRLLVKEALLGLTQGLAIGVVVGLVGWWWKQSILLGVVAAVAMALNMVAGALAGVAVPFGLRACKVDPALASSILVTTVTDVAGFLFFLGLAAIGLKLVGS
ncbi:magnesium transporter [bacterium]|nr:magnesium transporter [bacterium]